ncbi:MAG: radical SAM protein [Myxococcales bacterium]|nr:MAG: radical SAM protein [Myxococcales bacterium]
MASYNRLSAAEWERRLAGLAERERECVLCPRECGVDRNEKLGVCHAPAEISTSSVNLHFGEEPPITGWGGSGTVFLTHCNLACVFCQNYPISQLGTGRRMTEEELAAALVGLQKRGAHNINFVSPTHYTAAVIRAVHLAAEQGLSVPIVWNSNGYESVETLRLLEGIVDIWLPDLKYGDDANAKRYSRAPNYWAVATAAIKEMWRQAGQLVVAEDGIAERGVLVRHLVLPGDRSGTREVLRFLAEEISREVSISLMAQYFPAHEAPNLPGMDRQITDEEYAQALKWLEEFGLENGYTQEAELRFA